MERRSFMRLLGAGAVVAPVSGACVDLDNAVRLVDPPKVEPAPIPKVELATQADLDAHFRAGPYELYVEIRDGGRRTVLNAKTFLTKLEYSMIDVALPGDIFSRKIPSMAELSWTLEGVVTGKPKIYEG